MQILSLSRPAGGEYDPASAGYIALVPAITDAAGQLTSQRDAVVNLLASIADERASFRYAPGKWSIREVIGHLSDAERVMAYRLLRIGRGDETPLPGFDENTYVPNAGSEQRSVAGLLDEFTAVRNATIALVNGMPAGAWTRRGTANGKAVTTPALVYIICGHTEHHLKLLHERYGL